MLRCKEVLTFDGFISVDSRMNKKDDMNVLNVETMEYSLFLSSSTFMRNSDFSFVMITWQRLTASFIQSLKVKRFDMREIRVSRRILHRKSSYVDNISIF